LPQNQFFEILRYEINVSRRWKSRIRSRNERLECLFEPHESGMRVAILTIDNREHYKDYACTTPYFGTAPEALLQGFSKLPGLEVHVVACAQEQMRSPQKLAENIWFHSLVVPKIGWMRTLYQGCIRATRRKLREIRPDIVHGQGTERDCAISAVFSGLPNVLTIHGNLRLIAEVTKAKPFSFPWLAARLEGLTIPRSLGVVCITRYTRDAVASLAQQTWVVPNAVDQQFFEVENKPDESRTILCVGAVCVRKNQNAFIRALDDCALVKEARVLFLGQAVKGDPYAEEFFQLVNARPWCTYAGFADRDALKRYLRHVSLLVLPSLEDNCPMVVLESMAAGVPVVAANVGGVPDLIDDGKTGLLCDPLNPTSMRNTVEKMLAHSSFASEMAKTAKLKARECYHPHAIAGRHVEIYEDVLRTFSGSRRS
jgi:glycosyltransferase involved in cell wall biosynthesis